MSVPTVHHSIGFTCQPDPAQTASFTIQRRNRFWEVRDASGALVCITVYKRGALEVVRRLCH